jgi:hypothetical protein
MLYVCFFILKDGLKKVNLLGDDYMLIFFALFGLYVVMILTGCYNDVFDRIIFAKMVRQKWKE